MSRDHQSFFTVFILFALTACVLGGISILPEDSEATTDKTYSLGQTITDERLAAIGPNMDNGWSGTIPGITLTTVYVGGMTFVIGNGTFTEAGTFTITVDTDGGFEGYTQNIIVSDPSVTLVTSITTHWTLTSNNSPVMGSTTSLRAIVSPTDATDTTVSFQIVNGTGTATITRTWSDTYQGTYRNGVDIRADTPGTVTLVISANDSSGVTKSVPITVRPYSYLLEYEPNGGLSPDGDDYSWYDELTTTDSSQDVTFTITDFEPTREGYKFKGWSKSSSASAATYEAGDRITVSYGEEVILYAVWGQSNLTFNSIQSDSNVIVGSSFAYSPTMNVSGCSFSVTGASWLSVSGGTIYGTPTTPGTYNVKVTASCSGYTSASQSFTITVLSSLEFTTSPTNGLIAVER